MAPAGSARQQSLSAVVESTGASVCPASCGTLVVRLGAERYLVPLDQIAVLARAHESEISETPEGLVCFERRGSRMPVVRLGELLGRRFEHSRPEAGVLLVLRGLKDRSCAVLVDGVAETEQVEVKPVGSDIARLPGITGAALISDSLPALVLDLRQIVEAML